MVLIEFLALFLCGTFFGAAAYISIAQHPASMKAGVPFAAAFFPPMYRLAAPMQVVSALGGTLAGAIQWFLAGHVLWVIGAVLLVFVIPYTVVVLKPINDRLLDSKIKLAEAETENLLKQWAARHLVRTAASGLSFAVYLWASVTT